MRSCFILFVTIYKYSISPLLGSRCRFYPSCSEFALDALRIYPLSVSLPMIVKRILRCHPWNPGGYDPVRTKKEVL